MRREKIPKKKVNKIWRMRNCEAKRWKRGEEEANVKRKKNIEETFKIRRWKKNSSKFMIIIIVCCCFIRHRWYSYATMWPCSLLTLFCLYALTLFVWFVSSKKGVRCTVNEINWSISNKRIRVKEIRKQTKQNKIQ